MLSHTRVQLLRLTMQREFQDRTVNGFDDSLWSSYFMSEANSDIGADGVETEVPLSRLGIDFR